MAHSPAADLVMTHEFVLSLLRAQAPDVAGLDLRRVSAGWDNDMWRLGADLVVRIPRRTLARDLLLHELQVLPQLPAGFGFPRVEHAGRPEPALGMPYPWAIVSWTDGRPALEVPREQRHTWAAPFARALAALHGTTVAAPPANPFRGVRLAARATDMTARLTALHNHHAHPALLSAWTDAVQAPLYAGPGCLIHGDPHPGNIIVTPASSATLIDFGDVTAGDPATDLATAWLTFDAAGRREFRAAYGPIDEAMWTRSRGWAALIAGAMLHLAADDAQYAQLAVETAAELSRP